MRRKGLNREEADLLRKAKARGSAAREKLFAKYEDFLHSFAHKYSSDRLPYEEAFQVAALGLLKALNRFEPERNNSFLTFAYPTVEGEMKKYYRDHADLLRLPRPLRELRMRIAAEASRLATEEGREPDVPTLARRLRAEEEDIVEALAAGEAASVLSLEQPLGDEETPDLHRVVGGEDPSFEEVEVRVSLESALRRLPDRQRRIVELRLRKGWTQARIARELDVSQMHVSRLLHDALTRLQRLCAEGSPA